ncbi:somatostatin-1-like [Phycodurus eques]|uniref:somatostatin-1-like n=1 Tax=Phycodurus eques TaxID=693459 RepID=UPI002ACE9FEC|nr:somatostatin-1-like [Phycodurus eques]
MKMGSSSSWCLLVLLLGVCASSAALTRANARRGGTLGPYKQDLLDSSLAEVVLWDLLQMENEATEDDEDERGQRRSGEAEERPGAPGLAQLVGPRERKAGCKNFFWKTFTSC